MKVMLEGYRCERCEYEWIPREKGIAPEVCPKCKTRYWDRPPESGKSRAKKNKRK